MERKIGEIFTCDGKTYQVVKGTKCTYYDISRMCVLKASIIDPCVPSTRADKTSVVFKEINNMEIKNNQLTINIPEGMEIDLENSDLTKGIVKFKQSTITYEDVLKKLCMYGKSITVNENNVSKLVNLSRFMNIAKYYNKDWKPNWNNSEEPKYYIYYNYNNGKYEIGFTTNVNWGDIYFRFRDNIQSVIDNPNFKSILDAIYKD